MSVKAAPKQHTSLWEVPPGHAWETELIRARVNHHDVVLFLQENVQRVGAVVIRHVFSLRAKGDFLPVAQLLAVLEQQAPGLTSESLAAYLEAIASRNPMKHASYDYMDGTDGQRVSREAIPGARTYSKLGMARLHRLPARPEKLTMAHVKRALANGQFKDLRCDKDSHDFGPFPEATGPLDIATFLPRVVEASPHSGWSCGYSSTTGRVYVWQHTFNCNSFELVI